MTADANLVRHEEASTYVSAPSSSLEAVCCCPAPTCRVSKNRCRKFDAGREWSSVGSREEAVGHSIGCTRVDVPEMLVMPDVQLDIDRRKLKTLFPVNSRTPQ